jgi:hypothetical protein
MPTDKLVVQTSAQSNPDMQKLITDAVAITINVKEGKDVKTLSPITAVVRNGVALPLFYTDMERAKGDKAGVAYLAPHPQWIKDNTPTFLTWLGDVIIRRWCGSKIKNVLQGLNEEACADLVVDGVVQLYPNKNPKPDYQQFDIQEYVDLVEELSPRSETVAEINEQLKSLANELADLNDEDFKTIEEFRAAKLVLKNQIKSYILALDKKKRHKAETLTEGEEDTTPATQKAI